MEKYEKQREEEEIFSSIKKYNTLNDTVERAREYGDKAIADLDVFEDSQAKEALKGIVEFCIERAY